VRLELEPLVALALGSLVVLVDSEELAGLLEVVLLVEAVVELVEEELARSQVLQVKSN
jgi:hypothetical protein